MSTLFEFNVKWWKMQDLLWVWNAQVPRFEFAAETNNTGKSIDRHGSSFGSITETVKIGHLGI